MNRAQEATPADADRPAPARQPAPRGRPSTLCRGEDSAFAAAQAQRAARDAKPPLGTPVPRC